MSYHHPHHEQPSHDHHDSGEELALREKMVKLLEHWMKHNEGHALTYRQWAETAGAQSMGVVATYLEEAAEATLSINRQFEAALKCMRETP